MALPVSRPASIEDENIPRGIVMMLATTLFFILIDTCAKHLSQSFPVTQVVWARFFFHLLVVLALLGRPRRIPCHITAWRLPLQAGSSGTLHVSAPCTG